MGNTIKIKYEKMNIVAKFPPQNILKPFSTELHACLLLENRLGKDTIITRIVFDFEDRQPKAFLEKIDLPNDTKILKDYRINMNVKKEVKGTLVVHHTQGSDFKKRFHAKPLS
jgi:hypothetical protein